MNAIKSFWQNHKKKWWFWVIIVVLCVGIIGSDSSDTQEDTPSTTTVIVETTENEISETQTIKNDKTEQIIKALDFCCEQGYEKTNYRIEYDEKTNTYHIITFSETPGQIADELSTCILNGNLSPWYRVVSVYQNTSISLTELAKTIDNQASVHFSLYDKINNKDTRFLTCSNGTILFDMAQAISKT